MLDGIWLCWGALGLQCSPSQLSSLFGSQLLSVTPNEWWRVNAMEVPVADGDTQCWGGSGVVEELGE